MFKNNVIYAGRKNNTINNVYWYAHHNFSETPLLNSIQANVTIIGGGITGLTAAQSFAKRGLSVVLIEKNFCGSGATGKSSGFITPDSEKSFSALVKTYGIREAQKLWDFIVSGAHLIRKTIKEHTIVCDYTVQDTLVVASSKKDFKTIIEEEYKNRQELHYTAHLYDYKNIQNILASTQYHGGVSYDDTFGINAYQYCQGLKKLLLEHNVRIYEQTEALSIDNHTVICKNGTITSDYIVVCTDYAGPYEKTFDDLVYHVQTNLMISKPLSDKEIHAIFPQKPYMTWDTQLIYNYFRLTGDNRLLLGGGNVWNMYQKNLTTSSFFIERLKKYFSEQFPHITTIEWEYIWSGMIGVSKDLFPVMGCDEKKPWICSLAAVTGLPWGAALGNYISAYLLDGDRAYEAYFSTSRKFFINTDLGNILGKPISFALSHLATSNSF